MTPARSIALLLVVLATVSGLGYLGSQTVLARPGATVVIDRDQGWRDAPLPPSRRDVPAGQPIGPQQVDPAWVARTAAATGIPAPAVRAYADAQLGRPTGCEIGWTTLAGIGWVESHHGTIGGRALGQDGRSSSRILGPALDGRGGFAAIPATARTRSWHGDARWDHAVGPLQFIPSTWATWGSDGDGDGTADPNDIDDAAATAVRYLCADGHDLTSGSGWADAVFSYNHAQSYVDAVRAAAIAYARRVD
jgi:membrane-bound lytic murein transglycosylase B